MKAPQQRNLLTGRWSVVKARGTREDRMQMEIVTYFKTLRVPTAVCIHIPNEEMRKERFGKLLAMGAYPGASDLVFIRLAEWSVDPQPMVLCLEMKRLGEKPNDKQLAFGAAMKACGVHYEYADSKDVAIVILEKYGFVRKDVSKTKALAA